MYLLPVTFTCKGMQMFIIWKKLANKIKPFHAWLFTQGFVTAREPIDWEAE